MVSRKYGQRGGGYVFPIILILFLIAGVGLALYLARDRLKATADRLRRVYSCHKLGYGLECHKQDPPAKCKDVDPDGIYGWCLDPYQAGAYIGDQKGAHGITCKNWVKHPGKCPPTSCREIEPKDGAPQVYGWCLDSGEALRGTKAGPIEGEGCKAWAWTSNECDGHVDPSTPTSSPSTPTSSPSAPTPSPSAPTPSPSTPTPSTPTSSPSTPSSGSLIKTPFGAKVQTRAGYTMCLCPRQV